LPSPTLSPACDAIRARAGPEPAGPCAQPGGRPRFEKFTVEGQPVDRRAPELDTDHPVFPGQTRAPYHKTVDVEVTTIASGLDVPWAVELLPSGRFLITEKAGRLRILNKDGSTLHTITANMPPVYFRGQAGLLDVALDKNFASNHRIFFVYLRTVDAQNCAHAVDSAILDENAGAISNVTTIFQAAPFTNRAGVAVGLPHRRRSGRQSLRRGGRSLNGRPTPVAGAAP
jgi:glucose/arabinose dehydrogenase